jgi:hypothetical protein
MQTVKCKERNWGKWKGSTDPPYCGPERKDVSCSELSFEIMASWESTSLASRNNNEEPRSCWVTPREMGKANARKAHKFAHGLCADANKI